PPAAVAPGGPARHRGGGAPGVGLGGGHRRAVGLAPAAALRGRRPPRRPPRAGARDARRCVGAPVERGARPATPPARRAGRGRPALRHRAPGGRARCHPDAGTGPAVRGPRGLRAAVGALDRGGPAARRGAHVGASRARVPGGGRVPARAVVPQPGGADGPRGAPAARREGDVRGARLAAVLLAVVPALIAGACAYARSPAPYRPPTSYPRLSAESMRLGQTLYRRDCAFCHGNEGQGTTRAPDLTGGANGPA